MSDHPQPWLLNRDPQEQTHLTYKAQPVYAFLDEAARKYPDRTALIFHKARTSYKKLHRQCETLAANLREQGVMPGDRVAVMLPNLPSTVVAFFGVLKAGAITVMTNPLYMEKELVHQLNDANCKTMIVLDHLWPKIEKIVQDIPVTTFIIVRIGRQLSFPFNLLYPFKAYKKKLFQDIRPGERDGKRILCFSSLLKGKKRLSHLPENPREDIALLQYTGGTTGIAKGVMITHGNMGANIEQTQSILQLVEQEHEHMVCVLPFFHVYGLTVCLNLPISVGATLILVPRFDPRELLEALRRHNPTILPAAPAIYSALLQQKKARPEDFASLKICVSGSAPIPLDILHRFKKISGCDIIEGYGLTEASPCTHFNPLKGEQKCGSIGFPFPDTDCRIVDMDSGALSLPPGKQGELVIKGPQVMKGYWKREDETANAIRNGWLYTGDIATMDEQGYFYIVDRKKDLIISSGFNIYPREIDEVLYEHPKIQDAVTVGIPHPTRGEIVKAYIVLQDGEEMTRSEVITFCTGKLAKYKVPRKVAFRDDLPKTMVGKVLRRALREEEAQKAQASKV